LRERGREEGERGRGRGREIDINAGCYSQHYTEFRLFRIDLGASWFRKEKILKTGALFIVNDLRANITVSQTYLIPSLPPYSYKI
jgi:hypothetical protein